MARTGLAAIALGVAEEATRRAAAYLNERHQFGHPLATFQGAKMRAADAWIDTEAMRVTLWEAAWRIDTGQAGGRGRRRRQVVGVRGRPAGRARDASTCTVASGPTSRTRSTVSSSGESRSS